MDLEEKPFRGELFSIDLLKRHARVLAARQKIANRTGSNLLLPRLASNEKILRAYNQETLRLENARRVTPASEWLLDNFYLIEEQIRTARRHFSRSYSRELPHLSQGPLVNSPRIYELIIELISHVDARIDLPHLSAFINAYQEVATLKLGELWAIPIITRLALIENLRRVAVLLTAARRDRTDADEWAQRLIEVSAKAPSQTIVTVARMAQSGLSLSESFVTQFWRRAQEKPATFKVALQWLEEQLTLEDSTLEYLVQVESKKQAADQVTVGNSISSLRFLDATDWHTFVEDLSRVERILQGDPAQVYATMDFRTRDGYRHVVESVARHSSREESEVAEIAIKLARKNLGQKDERKTHVGYFLVEDEGLVQLELTAGVRLPARLIPRRLMRRFPLAIYLGSLGAFSLGLTVFFGLMIAPKSHSWSTVMGLSLLAFFCASQLGLALINRLVTILAPPRLLARLDFSEGIPEPYATLVVVPSMLGSPTGVASLLESLEIRYLSNRDPRLYFGLLTDFLDSPHETTPEDEALLQLASEGIQSLNAKYQADRPCIFFLFHRPRLWNGRDTIWMGYERKRGKLAELNRVLRGGNPACFSKVVGNLELLKSIKYVITLDTDTSLPKDSARELVGTMAHPLNRPVHHEKSGRVTAGYGILQPRVGVRLPSANRSHFARIFSSDAGIDPYTRAVSDVYQDLFQEGSFIGKGIYDVDAFEQAIANRFPDNRILSHDLLEGSYARSGLVSDVQLFEDFPSHFQEDARRRHRWMRGDWQIASWLFPRVPGAKATTLDNPLNILARWKILDNLRRCLVPIALLSLLVLGWVAFPGMAVWTTLMALATLFIPSLLTLTAQLATKPAQKSPHQHWRTVAEPALRGLGQSALSLVFLPYEATLCFDAMTRTFCRLCFTRRNLLEWQAASGSERSSSHQIKSFYASMWVPPLFAFLLGAVFLIWPNTAWEMALPLVWLWFLSPLLAWWISLPIESRPPTLTESQRVSMRLVARATWHYFETFVNANENWLPPDNFQEIPHPQIATRTSTTNMGMGLLSTLAAWDFGYLSTSQLYERVRLTFETMNRLERFNGHFYNWYDTRTLQPLLPRYISTVDNGNLASLLFTLREGLLELAANPFPTAAIIDGLRDTLGCWSQAARKLGSSESLALGSKLQAMDAQLAKTVREPRSILVALRNLLEMIPKLPPMVAEAESDLQAWRKDFEQLCHASYEDFKSAFPGYEEDERLGLPGGGNGWPVSLPQLEGELKRAIEAHPLPPFLDSLEGSVHFGRERANLFKNLAQQCESFAQMDFRFLFDETRKLFTIGYNVTNHQRDMSYYDLLASEARLASYVAIALGQVSQENWFALGRRLVSVGSRPALISWSGSMFEYLTPALIMPSYMNTLLDVSYQAAVNRQIEYGHQRGVPWGISESCYNLTDAQSNYQYRPFGVPGLGFKRGLADDLVIAPYATLMAFMIAPQPAFANLQRLREAGAEGRYGFFEALDYTPSRTRRGQSHEIVRCYMAHHQGMAFLSLARLLLDSPMQRRFEANPQFRAVELLLQERVPKETGDFYAHKLESTRVRAASEDGEAAYRVFQNPNTSPPEVHLLSNSRYHVMVTSAGGGYSSCQGTLLTRWREDPTRDCWGTFLYLRDLGDGRFWSVAYQPTLPSAGKYEAIFSQGRAEFRMRMHNIDSHLEVAISPEDDVEVRRLTLINYAEQTRTLDITSFAEIALNTLAADQAHPAFSKLFIQTEIAPAKHAILCSRRPRAPDEKPPWLFHLMLLQGQEIGTMSFETDRAAFLGRGRSSDAPAAMLVRNLSNTQGSVLDPAAAIRRAVRLQPQQTATITFVMGSAGAKEALLGLVEKYQDPSIANRVFELAWTHGLVTLRHLNTTEPEVQLFGRLAGSLLYSHPARRANANTLLQNRRGQRNLWSFGISGDLPIVLVRSTRAERLDFVRQMITAHAYWRLKGLAVDLIFLNEEDSVYRQSLHDQILSLVASGIEAHLLDKPGGIFVRQVNKLSHEDHILLQTAARILLTDEEGNLAEQLQRRPTEEIRAPAFVPTRRRVTPILASPLPKRELMLFNGFGGFAPDGREYVMILPPGRTTPAPWVNVIGNEHFGTLISESGSGYTWTENCHEFRLTPWNNDPVSDVGGEAFYIRDEQTGRYWSPTPLPVPASSAFVVRHGFGYSVFELSEDGIYSEMWIYVAAEDPIKFVRLLLHNQSGRARSLSVTGFWEWVLGELRSRNLMHIVTEMDESTGALLARNPYHPDFGEYTAFVAATEPLHSYTGSRTEFLGRNGRLDVPNALARQRLSGKVGIGADPCAALRVEVALQPDEQREVIFKLGAGRTREAAINLLHGFKSLDACRDAIFMVRAFWNNALEAVRVETPDPTVNILANGWLLYQTLSARMWSRTGFYQSGGAYGFRDQLQDAMALVHCRPQLLREHLLRVAGHQFREGDVQHWWHPPGNRGVRTHFSDDYLWLPYATCRYVEAWGDKGVLEERVAFLEARQLRPDEESDYNAPAISNETATLYEHCVRAIRHGLNFGAHGLPLMGCGDWNDGMNRVGEKGKGESVWLAFFLHDVLKHFVQLARSRGDTEFAQLCDEQQKRLSENIEQHAWDGGWYRRAYFDDGQPLGSQSNSECQIDSLPQSWAVLSGVGDRQRAWEAMNAVDARLVRRDQALIQLFNPPFNSSNLEPGYIKGYLPGVRENGGQYTHGAVWVVMAFAALGDSRRAWELLTLINPLHHSQTAESVARYKVEPYVIAADVYSTAPHVGRGGWTWYTGSAGWFYRLISESLLGIVLEVDRIRFHPCLPKEWKSYKVHYRHCETQYHIVLSSPDGTWQGRQTVVVDGVEQPEPFVPLLRDRADHRVEILFSDLATKSPEIKSPVAAGSL